MKDGYGRNINYLRLSITDRCNFRCRYCMPAEGVPLKDCGEILRYEELLKIVEAAADLGIRKVRVTGGEPLVRKGVLGFLRRVAGTPGIEEVALTTNGLLLAEQAQALKEAGVGRLNVSLDSLQSETFAAITRGGSLSMVLDGLEAADKAGLSIKLNMVVMRPLNEREIPSFAALSLSRPWSVRFIEYMPTLREEGWRKMVVSGEEILGRLRRHYPLHAISSDSYCGPAKPYRIVGAPGTIGIITPLSDHFCGSCNRIRVTATGLAKSCLFNDTVVDLKPYLHLPTIGLDRVLQQVIAGKPARHHLDCEQQRPIPFSMASIGG